jgi:hypothetical protein
VQDAGRFLVAGKLTSTNGDIHAAGPFEGRLDLRPDDSWPLRLDLRGKLKLRDADDGATGKGDATLTVAWRAVPE